MNQATFEKDIAMTILSQIEATYNATINMNGKTHNISALKTMGAKDIVYGKDFVQFKVQGAPDFNKFVIKLNENDLYDIEMWNIEVSTDFICEKVDEYNDIYAEQLGNLLVKEVLYK